MVDRESLYEKGLRAYDIITDYEFVKKCMIGVILIYIPLLVIGHIVASFLPQQMKTEHLRNEGIKLLKNYLEYAMKVSRKEFIPNLKPQARPNVEWYLKFRIRQDLDKNRKFNMKITEEMPFADLTLRTEEAYLGVILTDDDLYFQNVSSKETHVYNPFTLAMKHWKFRGIFSREYWQDKEQVIDRLIVFSNHLT